MAESDNMDVCRRPQPAVPLGPPGACKLIKEWSGISDLGTLEKQGLVFRTYDWAPTVYGYAVTVDAQEEDAGALIRGKTWDILYRDGSFSLERNEGHDVDNTVQALRGLCQNLGQIVEESQR